MMDIPAYSMSYSQYSLRTAAATAIFKKELDNVENLTVSSDDLDNTVDSLNKIDSTSPLGKGIDIEI